MTELRMARGSLFLAALSTEGRKLRSARVPLATAIMLDGGIAVISSAALLAVSRGDPATTAKLGPVVAQGGWTGYLAGAVQIVAVAGMLGFGLVLAWLFGREFTDGTVTGLFALPVGRGTIATAKLVVFACWVVAVSTGLILTLLAGGLVSGFGAPGPQAWGLLARTFGVALLTAALAVPAGWAATLGRGLLAGVATIVGLVILAQIAVFAGVGGWFPFSSPGLWAAQASAAAGSLGSILPFQLGLVLPVAAVFALLTHRSWRGLQLDR